jgi:carboxylesterase
MVGNRTLPEAESFYFEGNSVGCLIAHGFTSTTQSVRYLGEYLAREGGLTVIAPRLTGHGTTPADMARSTAEDWIRSVESALEILRRRCDKIFCAGLGMGGTLSLYLAAMYPETVAGVVAINGVVFLNNADFARLAFMAGAPDTVPSCCSDIKRGGSKEIAYAVVAVPAIRQLYALLGVVRDLLPRVTCPAQLFQSRQDHVIPAGNGPYILEHIRAQTKELIWLDDSYHVATLDNDAERIAQMTLAFIRKHSE